ncbi:MULTISPECIES: cell envelope integrity protein TolA [Shewanella]|uniref:Cell envelope integrity protein TolA n=2 Tax=Unclassified Bacteria TaxID=49928 RepID=A0AAU6VWW8_UNCXX|nr:MULTISPECIES: cell envelope integrity protein TolA [Shewanella]MBO2616534.1 cell envelope integrity protein TolA [Shewanella algae]MCT8981588.1 cell envelope integrity protein TolA [Shewanella algae]MDE0568794.1 cell envelope integrity protein TolA [Shewanella sp. K8]
MAGKSDFTVPFIISAVLHIGVIAILAMGVDFQDKSKLPTPQAQSAPVQAVVVDQQKVDDYVQKLKQDKAAAERRERERQQELDRKANEAKKAREQEQERIRKLEVERKQKELETQKAADAAKAAKLKEQQEKEKAQKAEAERKAKEQQRKEAEEAALKAEQKRKAEEAAAKKAEEERKRKEAERKAKEEAERKRKAEEEARRRQEQELADALAAEQAALSATRNRQVMSEVDRYRAMITATIQRNLVVDESMRGKVCKVKVRLAKDGFVTNSQIIEGDPVVCRAAKAAINKAGRLPVSQEPDVYQLMKEINLEVRPEFN